MDDVVRSTLPATLLARGSHPSDTGRAALRWKEGAEWRAHTWADYAAFVVEVGAGLRAAGIQAGDRVAILSTNRPEWVIFDLAVLAIGAASVPIYPTSPPNQVAYVLRHSGARLAACGDREQRAKVASIRGECPALERVVSLGEDTDGDAAVLAWSALRRLGSEAGEGALQAVRDGIDRLDPQALATVVYTSGTTGPPKGAMLSHGNLAAMVESLSALLVVGREDETLSFLPLSHIAERLQGELVAVTRGYTVNFGEGIDKVRDNLVEVQPTILLCVPRLWEKIHGTIQEGLRSAPPVRQKLFAWALRVGWRVFEVGQGQATGSAWLSLQHAVANRLIYSKVRARLGLTRGHRFISGAAPLSSEVGRFFASLGIVINEVYGQTECTGVSNANPAGGVRFGTVGPALPGVEVRLAEDGEVLVRGGNVFMGYLNDPAATAEALEGGWLHTGDVGDLDATGYLRITDRKKDIIVTAGGKNVAPQNLENRMKGRAGLSQVVVLGDRRPYLVALVTLDAAALPGLGLAPEPGVDPNADPRLRALVQRHFDEVNADLGRWEQVKSFTILGRDFTVADDELTPTLKVRRRHIQKRYSEVIDSLYGAADAVS